MRESWVQRRLSTTFITLPWGWQSVEGQAAGQGGSTHPAINSTILMGTVTSYSIDHEFIKQILDAYQIEFLMQAFVSNTVRSVHEQSIHKDVQIITINLGMVTSFILCIFIFKLHCFFTISLFFSNNTPTKSNLLSQMPLLFQAEHRIANLISTL